MNTLEYMQQQLEKHKLNLNRAMTKKSSDEEINNIKKKIGYYAEAVAALKEKGTENERKTD